MAYRIVERVWVARGIKSECKAEFKYSWCLTFNVIEKISICL